MGIDSILDFFNWDTPTWIFFSNSEDCPCYSFYEHAQQLRIPNIKLIRSTQDHKSLKGLKLKKKVVIFAHGDLAQLQCFLWMRTNGQNRESYIPNNWWSKMVNVSNHILFHSCYGAFIIQGTEMRLIFSNWVSYKDAVYYLTGNGDINTINRNFIKNLNTEIKRRTKMSSLKIALESTYISMKADLVDSNNQAIPGRRWMIGKINRNIGALISSS